MKPRGSAAGAMRVDHLLLITRRATVPAVVSTALLTLALTAHGERDDAERNGRIAFQAPTEDGSQIFTIRT